MVIEVRSRTGNAILGVLGVLYLCSSLGLLAYDLVQTWGAASLVDRAVQVALVVTALGGAFFAFTAARNLSPRLPRPEAPLHREGAVSAR